MSQKVTFWIFCDFVSLPGQIMQVLTRKYWKNNDLNGSWPVINRQYIRKSLFWDALFNTFYKYDPCCRRCIQQWWGCVCLINLESWIQFGEELGIERQLQIHSRLWRRKEELMHFANCDCNQVIKRFSFWHFWFVNNQRRDRGEGPSLKAS